MRVLQHETGSADAGDGRASALPAAVMLLAENLDAVLAAGEDLAAMSFDLTALAHPGAGLDRTTEGSLGGFIARVRSYEGTLLLRLGQARAAAARLTAEDHRFGAVARLFLAGATGLDEALATAAKECARRSEAALCPLAFMRSRGLVGAECGAFTGLLSLTIDDTYPVAGTIPLGDVMDQAATFLDVLDRYYVLFPEPEVRQPAGPAVPAQASPT